MKKYRKLAALCCALSMLLMLTACGSSTNKVNNGIPESTGGKDLVASVSADEVFSLNCNRNYSFNPLIATNHSNQLVCSLVYENMIELDNEFNVIPNIILDWQPIDDSGNNWKFNIDTSHTFSDGTPVTGKDVRYSLERAINSDRFAGRFASFQGVSYDETTIYVSLGIGDTDFIKLLNIPVIKSGTYPDEYPIGSGPYAYNEDYTALVPNKEYYSRTDDDGNRLFGEPPVDTVYLKEYATMEDNLSAFESGLIDAVLNDPSSYTNLGYASTDEVHTYSTTNMHYVAFNHESKYLADSSLRHALTYAFDRAYFVKLLNGNAVAATLPMYPSCSIYPSSYANSLNYNIQTVKAIFDNAGLKDYDEDGKLEYLNAGNKVSLKFLVCSDSSAKAGVAEKFAEDMGKLGLTVDVQEVTWDEYKTALLEGDYDLYYGEVRLRNNFDVTELLQVRPDDADEYSKNLNFSQSRDNTYLDLINKYLSASSFEKANSYRTLCEYIVSSGGLVTIGFEKQQIITHRGVCRGLNPNAGNPFYDFVNWTINLEQ